MALGAQPLSDQPSGWMVAQGREHLSMPWRSRAPPLCVLLAGWASFNLSGTGSALEGTGTLHAMNDVLRLRNVTIGLRTGGRSVLIEADRRPLRTTVGPGRAAAESATAAAVMNLPSPPPARPEREQFQGGEPAGQDGRGS